MTMMMSRGRTALPKLNFSELENVPGPDTLRLDGMGMYTDRGGGKREALPHMTPRFTDHNSKGQGRISVIKITPRSSDGSNESLDQWSSSPENSPKQAQMVEIDFRSHRIQKKGAQISMLDLQNMVTPRNNVTNQRGAGKKGTAHQHSEWKKPQRPSFLPPIDISHLGSKDVSPENTPQTPRFLDEHPLDSDRTPRESVPIESRRALPARQSLALNHETPRVNGASNHIDMQSLFKQDQTGFNQQGGRFGKKKPVKKYGLIDDNNNTPRGESQDTFRGGTAKRLSSVQRIKPNIKVDGLDVVTPRDIGNLTIESDADESSDEDERQEVKLNLRAPVRDSLNLRHGRDKIPSILNNGDKGNKAEKKLIKRKSEKKILRFNVETDRMQGQHQDVAFFDDHLLRVNDSRSNAGSAVPEFSRPSTVATEAKGWFPDDESKWEGDHQENVERWWDGNHRQEQL